MTPTPPKNEEGIALALDKWITQMEEIERHGDSHKLADVYKMAALKSIMVGKARDYFDTVEDKDFDTALIKCKEYAVKKRLEGESKKGGDPMDCDRVENQEGEEQEEPAENGNGTPMKAG